MTDLNLIGREDSVVGVALFSEVLAPLAELGARYSGHIRVKGMPLIAGSPVDMNGGTHFAQKLVG